MTDADRTTFLLDALAEASEGLLSADPVAFRRKYRTMAADPFAFYRGSAAVFYADMREREDRWTDEQTSRVWIQGDLHAQNFGTYMDGEGRLVFDVNDFDEAYLGHFTWDLQRLVASVALMGWTKALSDDDITMLCSTYLRAYLDQASTSWTTTETTSGPCAWGPRPDSSSAPCCRRSCRRGSTCSTA
jgi:uncharacterized protein (DUF2252 family)